VRGDALQSETTPLETRLRHLGPGQMASAKDTDVVMIPLRMAM
jgi:hypothetical protein